MRIGVPKEIHEGEKRVATTPEVAELLKKLGFLDPSGSPTPRYNEYRHKTQAKRILAEAIRELYAELFALDEKAHKAKRDHLIGMISRVSGQEDKYNKLSASTFQALTKLADFDAVPVDEQPSDDDAQEIIEEILSSITF